MTRTGWALGALAVSAFAIGTTEFVIAGLLPELAGDLGVSVPGAGLLVSGYALGVVVGAPLVTWGVRRWPRKRALLALLVLFVAGNGISAGAQGMGVMLTGRVLAALCHGAFLGVGSLTAAEMVGEDKRARAIAGMFTGLTLSTVAGVPMGTAIGQHWGWRVTFGAVAVLGIVGMAGIALLVPKMPAREPGGEEKVFRGRQVWLALGMTALGFGAVYAPYTYIAPIMEQVAGYPPGDLWWLLMVFGTGLVLGNWLGAKAADRWLMETIIVLLAALTGLLLAFQAWPSVGTLFALGVVAFAAVAAFNLGNATGAYLAGLAVTTQGYAATSWVGAGMATAGLGIAVWSAALTNRETDRNRDTPALAG